MHVKTDDFRQCFCGAGKHIIGMRKCLAHFEVSIYFASLSLPITSSVSTYFHLLEPPLGLRAAFFPSNANGMVTMPTVSMPSSRATLVVQEQHRCLCPRQIRRYKYRFECFHPIAFYLFDWFERRHRAHSWMDPAPSPFVERAPSCILSSNGLWSSACLSVLQIMNHTFDTLGRINVYVAAAAYPITLMIGFLPVVVQIASWLLFYITVYSVSLIIRYRRSSSLWFLVNKRWKAWFFCECPTTFSLFFPAPVFRFQLPVLHIIDTCSICALISMSFHYQTHAGCMSGFSYFVIAAAQMLIGRTMRQIQTGCRITSWGRCA